MHTRLLVALAVLAALPASASAAARTVTIDAAGAPQSWTGTNAQGFNVTFFDDHLPNQCGTDPQDYCDDTLVHFTSADALEDSNLTFRIEGFAHSDYDLRVYTSDSSGAVGDYLGSPTGDNAGLIPLATFAGDPESLTTWADPDSWFLVRVVYFSSPGDEDYTGKVSWTGATAGA